jgi:hypothetical protein
MVECDTNTPIHKTLFCNYSSRNMKSNYSVMFPRLLTVALHDPELLLVFHNKHRRDSKPQELIV